MDEAQALADRVAVMLRGEIIALGTATRSGRDHGPRRSRLCCPDVSLGDIPTFPRSSGRSTGERVRVTTTEPVLASQRIKTWAIDMTITSSTSRHAADARGHLSRADGAENHGATPKEAVR